MARHIGFPTRFGGFKPDSFFGRLTRLPIGGVVEISEHERPERTRYCGYVWGTVVPEDSYAPLGLVLSPVHPPRARCSDKYVIIPSDAIYSYDLIRNRPAEVKIPGLIEQPNGQIPPCESFLRFMFRREHRWQRGLHWNLRENQLEPKNGYLTTIDPPGTPRNRYNSAWPPHR